MPLTPADLKSEILSGPLAAELAPFWADVFPTESEPPDAPLPDAPVSSVAPEDVAARAQVCAEPIYLSAPFITAPRPKA